MTGIGEIRTAYAACSSEYAEALGTMEQTHPEDRALVRRWGLGLHGPVLDAGCGPGHWTDFLRRGGAEVEGLDLVPEFIAHARRSFPFCRFRVGSLTALGVPDGSLSGVLCWYSLIHTPPAQLSHVLAEVRRVLRPGGSLLLGFFPHPYTEGFPHAVATAYRWSVDDLSEALRKAGFSVEELHRRTDPGVRPHAALLGAG